MRINLMSVWVAVLSTVKNIISTKRRCFNRSHWRSDKRVVLVIELVIKIFIRNHRLSKITVRSVPACNWSQLTLSCLLKNTLVLPTINICSNAMVAGSYLFLSTSIRYNTLAHILLLLTQFLNIVGANCEAYSCI